MLGKYRDEIASRRAGRKIQFGCRSSSFGTDGTAIQGDHLERLRGVRAEIGYRRPRLKENGPTRPHAAQWDRSRDPERRSTGRN